MGFSTPIFGSTPIYPEIGGNNKKQTAGIGWGFDRNDQAGPHSMSRQQTAHPAEKWGRLDSMDLIGNLKASGIIFVGTQVWVSEYGTV